MADKVNESVKEVVDNASNITSDTINTVSNTASNAVSTGVESVKDVVNNLSSSSGALMGLVIVIVVALIASIVIYWFVVDKVFNKNSVTIDKTKVPVKGFTTSVIPIDNMPLTANGFKKTFTFWIYLDNMNTGKDMYKHVFHIGSEDDIITTSSPMVFIGKNKNELHVRFGKDSNKIELTDFTSTYTKLGNINNDSDFIKYMEQGVTIDYLPMQRWVHVAIVVNETLTDGSGGMIHTYLDSELTSVTKTCNPNLGNDNMADCTTAKKLDNLDLNHTGSLIVGGTGKTTSDFGFNGLLSKVKIFNYDLNSRDVYNDYSDGPIDGLLNSLGYGLRTPVYKLSGI